MCEAKEAGALGHQAPGTPGQKSPPHPTVRVPWALLPDVQGVDLFSAFPLSLPGKDGLFSPGVGHRRCVWLHHLIFHFGQSDK